MPSRRNEFVHCDQVHEYLDFKGGKFSKSRGVAVEAPCFLSKSAPDSALLTDRHPARDAGHGGLSYDNSGAIGTDSLHSVHAWTKSELPPGQALRELAALFKKLDESVIEEE